MDLEVNLSVTDLIFALVIEQLFQTYLVITAPTNYVLFFFTFIISLVFYFEYREWNADLSELDDVEVHVVANVILDIISLFAAYQLVSVINAPINIYYFWFTVQMGLAALWHLGHIIYYRQIQILFRRNIDNLLRDTSIFSILATIGLIFPVLDDWTRIGIIVSTFLISTIITLYLSQKQKQSRVIPTLEEPLGGTDIGFRS